MSGIIPLDPADPNDSVLSNAIRTATWHILNAITGEDPDREGLVETPRRVAKMYLECLSGYQIQPEDLFKTFDSDGYEGLVIVRDIPFYSMCEHHMLPFHGIAHIGYIANGRIVGLSKLARLVECYARRLQVQERMTKQIADAITEFLSPDAMVIIQAHHLCMESRGIEKPGASAVTSAVRGAFLTEPEARAEYLALKGSR